MENNITIMAENGCKLAIKNLVRDRDFFSADVNVKTDWFEANINFISAMERIIDFSKNIDNIISKENNQANFINDDGNFDLELTYNESTGRIQLNGILIKDMMDESRIEYTMESDYLNLENLQSKLHEFISDRND